jgi:hypothetical protein
VHTLDDVPFSPGWGYEAEETQFDAYYMDDQDEFAIGCLSDDEGDLSAGEYRTSTPQLPHIRITSH